MTSMHSYCSLRFWRAQAQIHCTTPKSDRARGREFNTREVDSRVCVYFAPCMDIQRACPMTPYIARRFAHQQTLVARDYISLHTCHSTVQRDKVDTSTCFQG